MDKNWPSPTKNPTFLLVDVDLGKKRLLLYRKNGCFRAVYGSWSLGGWIPTLAASPFSSWIKTNPSLTNRTNEMKQIQKKHLHLEIDSGSSFHQFQCDQFGDLGGWKTKGCGRLPSFSGFFAVLLPLSACDGESLFAKIWWKEPYDTTGTSKMAAFQSSGTSSIRSHAVGTYSITVGLLRSI